MNNILVETLDKKTFHINEGGDKRYPEPDVPVQDAWENMQQLLLQTPAVPVSQSGFTKWIGKGMGKIVMAAVAVTTVSVITFVVISKKEQKTAPPVTYTSDSISANQPVIASDTLPSPAKEIRASFEFDDTPVKIVAAEMEKKFGIKVILKGDMDKSRLTTQLDSVTLKEMLNILSKVLDWKYKIDAGNKQVTITVNERKP